MRDRLILVVDDSEYNLVLLHQVLRHYGYRVALASSGEEAIAQADRLRPDLVLLDLAMPGMDGYRTLERLRQSEATARIPVVALTDGGDERMRRLRRTLGFSGEVSRPIRPSALLEALSEPPARVSARALELVA